MDTDNIVETLTYQHRQLQTDLGKISELFLKPDQNVVDISSLLKQFSLDLVQHLHIENEVFYVELLRKMKEKGKDTAKTELFISEMDKIGKAVMMFLGSYDSEEKIKNALDVFKNDLSSITETLNLRIESEEEGVYTYWKSL